MKIFTNKKIVQKVIIAIVIVLSFNFIIPNYSQADTGGVLLGPIVDLLSAIGDTVMSALQFFFYDGGFSIGETADIFSGFNQFTLPASKVRKGEVQLSEYGMEPTDSPDTIIDSENFDKGWRNFLTLGWLEKDYGIPVIKYTPEAIFSNEVPALDVNFINPKDWGDTAMNEKSITKTLHSTIANWYLALRNLAIVALLSVLLYVGVRMVISSTASDKAKYKQMIMDWIIAICIVFTLHYIMSFILTVTDMVTAGISNAGGITVQVKDNDGDISFDTDLTGLCRLQIQYEDLGARALYLLFYLALVIYTVMFTWIYVKRAITMAFLTLMAPLVAITYPIDKIGDGKAQAYGIWLKEYIFNALLQPFHLIIYTIFLGSSMEIAVQNPIYAILFLAFIIPAEKLLRKMFGFEKASTAGSFAAGFGGAAAFKAVSGLISKGAKGSKGTGGNNSVRTKKPISGKKPSVSEAFGGTSGNENPSVGGNESPLLENRGENTQNNGFTQTQSGLWVPSSASNSATSSRTAQQASQQTMEREENLNKNHWEWSQNDTRGMGQYLRDGISGTWNDSKMKSKLMQTKGVRALKNGTESIRAKADRLNQARRNVINKIPKPLRNTARGSWAVTKQIGKAGLKAAGVATMAGVGATFGLAAGIAGDDLDDVLKYGVAGATLGATALPALGRGLTNSARGVGNSLSDTYNSAAFGSREAQLMQQEKEWINSSENEEKMMETFEEIYGRKASSTEKKDFMKGGAAYYNADITDTKDIQKCMKLEKELSDQLAIQGENNPEDLARTQAMVIAGYAAQYDKKDLRDESKVQGLQNNIVDKLRSGGLEQAQANKQAKNIIKMIKKYKGV